MLVFQRYSWWLGTMVAFAFFLAVASQMGALSPFQNVFLRVTAPFEGVLTGASRPFAEFVGGVGDSGDLREENDQLRIENEQLRNQLAELQEQGQRVRELEQALNITRGDAGGSRVAASVVHRDLSPFSDVVSIDRGSKDGIKNGMVVVSAQGTLLG